MNDDENNGNMDDWSVVWLACLGHLIYSICTSMYLEWKVYINVPQRGVMYLKINLT